LLGEDLIKQFFDLEGLIVESLRKLRDNESEWVIMDHNASYTHSLTRDIPQEALEAPHGLLRLAIGQGEQPCLVQGAIGVGNHRDDTTSLDVANLALGVSLTATRARMVRSDAVIEDIVGNLGIVHDGKS
jgi:hypothetical protein